MKWVKKCYESLDFTHLNPMFHFYTFWKRYKTFCFYDVFRGCKNETFAWNELTIWKDVTKPFLLHFIS